MHTGHVCSSFHDSSVLLFACIDNVMHTVHVCSSLHAILALDRANAPSVIRKGEEGVLCIERLSYIRFAACLSVMCLRLIVAIILCILGCQYLIYTTSLPDLLLNAVALEFGTLRWPLCLAAS